MRSIVTLAGSRRRDLILTGGSATISGTAKDSYTLTANSSGWIVTPTSYTYQWRKAGTNIAGATSATYVVAYGDVGSTISVVITASKVGYSSTTVTSPVTSAVTYGATIGDTFNRVANTSTLGSTDTGAVVAWTAQRGTWGIGSANRALMTAGSSGIRNMATFESSSTTGHIKTTIYQGTAPFNFGVLHRYVDLNNYVLVGKTNVSVIIGNVITYTFAHTSVPFTDSPSTPVTWLIDSYLVGDTLTVYVNGTLINTCTIPAGSPTGTKVGMAWYGAYWAAGQFDSIFYYA